MWTFETIQHLKQSNHSENVNDKAIFCLWQMNQWLNINFVVSLIYSHIHLISCAPVLTRNCHQLMCHLDSFWYSYFLLFAIIWLRLHCCINTTLLIISFYETPSSKYGVHTQWISGYMLITYDTCMNEASIWLARYCNVLIMNHTCFLWDRSTVLRCDEQNAH